MNQVEISYTDKQNRQAAIVLNGATIGFGMVSEPKGDSIDVVDFYLVRLANIHNQSNPITFKARTLNQLVRKIEKHPYQLVRF